MPVSFIPRLLGEAVEMPLFLTTKMHGPASWSSFLIKLFSVKRAAICRAMPVLKRVAPMEQSLMASSNRKSVGRDGGSPDDEDAWDGLGPLLDGLAHADNAIRVAARGVNKHHDLGPRGAWILSRIHGGVCLPADLADAFDISRSLMTIELNRVIKAGLVKATPSVADGRRTELKLTPRGKTACRQVRAETARLIRRNLAAYSAGDIRLVTRMLADVRRIEPEDGQLPETFGIEAPVR